MNIKENNKGDVFITHYQYKDIYKILADKHGEKFYYYRKKFEKISNELIYNEIPMYIVLSVNSYCNLCCKMCLRNFQNSTNNKIDLPIGCISNIMQQCKELQIPSVFLGATSECLLRKDIKDVLNEISMSGTMDNFLITNGTMLNEELCNYLVDIQYERVYISLDAALPETYKMIRGADISVVEKNINNLIQIKEKKNSKLPIIRVSFVKQNANESELALFIEKWKNKVDLIDIQNLIDYKNIDNLKEIDELEDKEFICPAPFRMLYIDYYGDIYPCASDYCYHMKIGNISEMTIKEAWNSEIMNNLRKSIKNKSLGKICKNCACSTNTED